MRRKVAEPRIPPETEAHFQAFVVEAARVLGWKLFHVYDSYRSPAGFPDLVMVRRSRLIFAELKREKGVVSVEQEEWLAALSFTDAESYLWRPADRSDILAVLR